MAQYREVDESARCSTRVNQARTILPAGILLHTTAGSSSLGWLLGGSAAAGSPASADYLIDRDGTRHKITPAGRFAYHAGSSAYRYKNVLYQDDQVSQILIGVECEATDSQAVLGDQLASLAELIALQRVYYGWRWGFPILGHYEVATPEGRRLDPMNLDYGALFSILMVEATRHP